MSKHQIFRLLVLITGLAAFMGESMAAQLRIAEDNAEIAAVISAREVSRLALDGDRIASLSSVPQGFSVEHDAETGDLYIVPIPGVAITGLINMFITTEAGRSYQLLLEPRDIPSEQIIIRHSQSPVAAAVETSAPRREVLGNLVRAVITGELLDDYKRASVANDALGNVEGIVLVEVWRGAAFVAWKIEIADSAEMVTTNLKKRAAAIWLSKDGRDGVIVMEVDKDGQ